MSPDAKCDFIYYSRVGFRVWDISSRECFGLGADMDSLSLRITKKEFNILLLALFVWESSNTIQLKNCVSAGWITQTVLHTYVVSSFI